MKRTRKLLLLTYVLFFASCKPKELSLMSQLTDRVRLNTETEFITAGLVKVSKEVTCSPEKTYFWFEKGRIMSTQAAYSGKLLQGTYIAYDRLSKQLSVKGEFYYGLKQGDWYLWRADGSLSQIQHWKSGLQHGKTVVYDSVGMVKTKLKFNKGLEVKAKKSKLKAWMEWKIKKVFKGKKK